MHDQLPFARRLSTAFAFSFRCFITFGECQQRAYSGPGGVAEVKTCYELTAAHPARVTDRPTAGIGFESNPESLLLPKSDELADRVQGGIVQRVGQRSTIFLGSFNGRDGVQQ